MNVSVTPGRSHALPADDHEHLNANTPSAAVASSVEERVSYITTAALKAAGDDSRYTIITCARAPKEKTNKPSSL